MKLMRLAMCVAVFAVVGGIAVAEDINVQQLKAQLAAQEARLNDLQAKMNSRSGGGEAEGIVSLRKNAVVTIGGTVNTRYFYRSGKIDSRIDTRVNGGQNEGALAHTASRQKTFDHKSGDLRVSDAKVDLKIDVNEYFDAFLKMDLQHDSGRISNVGGIAQNYWVRWKNVCNTGFGLLVGRDGLKFGDSQPIGILDAWTKDNGGMHGDIMGWNDYATYNRAPAAGFPAGGTNNHVVGTSGDGMLVMGGIAPAHTTYNWTRTTQINPYWESQDGKLRFDISLIQSIDRINGHTDARSYYKNEPSNTRYRRSINYGLGSMTARVVWKPIEGLKLTASAMNMHSRNGYSTTGTWGNEGRRTGLPANATTLNGSRIEGSSNDTTINLAFQYRPCFFNRLNVWGQWMHGWNTAWIKDMDSDVVNFGASFDITSQLTFFAQGDYVRTKNDQSHDWNKGTGWAAYTGLNYKLPYGVNLEAGWRHEQVKYKGRAGDRSSSNAFHGTHTKYKGDTIYAHLGFDF